MMTNKHQKVNIYKNNCSLIKKDNENTIKKQTIKLPVFGLSNLGNTCFFNSCMQCMLASSSFIQNLKENKEKFSYNSLMREILDLGLQKEKSPRGVFRHLVKKNRMYGYYYQQDSHEAFVNLLDIMEKEIKEVKKRYQFDFDFQSYLIYRLKCFNCGVSELIFQDNTNIMLDIERKKEKTDIYKGDVLNKKMHKNSIINNRFIKLKNEKILNHPNVKASGFDIKNDTLYEDILPLVDNDNNQPKTKLEEMIDNYFDYNFYSQKEHDYRCDDCGTKSTYGYKKHYMFKNPKILVLCIKKFAKSSSSFFGRWRKSTVNVTYPEYLDLTKHTLKTSIDKSSDGKYRLLGAVNHSGGLGGGHYTAYVRKNENWYYISDSYYKESNLKSALNADAYLVFYELL